MSKKILVTVSDGLVGKTMHDIIEKEKNTNEEWIFTSRHDANLLDYNETIKLLKKYQPSHVLHLAVFLSGAPAMKQKKFDYFINNSQMDNNLLKACVELKIKNVLSTTSTVMFPDIQSDTEFNEKCVFNGEPNYDILGYATAKRSLQIMSRLICDQYHDYCYTTCIVSNIYGPYSNFSLTNGQIVSMLMHKGYLAYKNGEKIWKGYGRFFFYLRFWKTKKTIHLCKRFV